MTDVRDVLAKHVQPYRMMLNAGRGAIRDATIFMKVFKGTFDQKKEKWEFFEGELAKLVSTLVRMEKLDRLLRNSDTTFAALNPPVRAGNDDAQNGGGGGGGDGGDDGGFEKFDANLKAQVAAMSAPPGEIRQHELMQSMCRIKNEMLDEDEIEMEESDDLGKCAVSQQDLNELPRSKVYKNSVCPHVFSDKIFTVMDAHGRVKCPQPGCNKMLSRNVMSPMSE